MREDGDQLVHLTPTIMSKINYKLARIVILTRPDLRCNSQRLRLLSVISFAQCKRITEHPALSKTQLARKQKHWTRPICGFEYAMSHFNLRRYSPPTVKRKPADRPSMMYWELMRFGKKGTDLIRPALFNRYLIQPTLDKCESYSLRMNACLLENDLRQNHGRTSREEGKCKLKVLSNPA